MFPLLTIFPCSFERFSSSSSPEVYHIKRASWPEHAWYQVQYTLLLFNEVQPQSNAIRSRFIAPRHRSLLGGVLDPKISSDVVTSRPRKEPSIIRISDSSFMKRAHTEPSKRGEKDRHLSHIHHTKRSQKAVHAQSVLLGILQINPALKQRQKETEDCNDLDK